MCFAHIYGYILWVCIYAYMFLCAFIYVCYVYLPVFAYLRMKESLRFYMLYTCLCFLVCFTWPSHSDLRVPPMLYGSTL
jgi:hypothetical protein